MSSGNTIKVVARFRPQNRVENESGGQPIVKFEGDDSLTVDVCPSTAVRTLMPNITLTNLRWLTIMSSQ